MGTIVKRNVVKRKKGYLYYVDAKGNLLMTKMLRGRKKERKGRR